MPVIYYNMCIIYVNIGNTLFGRTLDKINFKKFVGHTTLTRNFKNSKSFSNRSKNSIPQSLL